MSPASGRRPGEAKTQSPGWNQGAKVHLRLEFMQQGHRQQYGRTLKNSELKGLPLEDSDETKDVRFDIVRDAGTFHCAGALQKGQGGGVFEFEASAGFVDELKRRGMEAPTFDQQLQLAVSGVGFELLDELVRQKASVRVA